MNYITECRNAVKARSIRCRSRRHRPMKAAGRDGPETGSPDKDNLLKRMRKVDPKQAERYRQRTGE